ncbi:MAG: helix-turn-helix domain-containing protein [Nitrospiraceae bacterium]|nr:MAG: helix-turn-helix domain-containing protein [Nitrospiraceae bacterium]
MQKISSGVKNLDSLIDSLYIGDNIVWEVDAGTSYDVFIQHFIKQSFHESQTIVYVSFNSSPQNVLSRIKDFMVPDYFILFDCFTSGKGKNDETFLKFYKNMPGLNIVRIEDPKNIDHFTHKINKIEESLPPGARYVFDSLTGMQDLWGNEDDTYKFFTYMCPRLYDLETVAYWILEKDAHSQKFKANLRHITQVVCELYSRREELYIKAHKLEGRPDREAFKPHCYEIKASDITISYPRKGLSREIGSRIKEARARLGMNQKELADKADVTPSFISQIENNQISPSLSSFLQIADALNIDPTELLQQDAGQKALPWHITRESIRQRLYEREGEYSIYSVVSNGDSSVYLTVINEGKTLKKHFLQHKKNEFIYVLSGEVSVKVEHNERHLRKGDSLYLKGSIPSEWRNTSRGEVDLLIFYT